MIKRPLFHSGLYCVGILYLLLLNITNTFLTPHSVNDIVIPIVIPPSQKVYMPYIPVQCSPVFKGSVFLLSREILSVIFTLLNTSLFIQCTYFVNKTLFFRCIFIYAFLFMPYKGFLYFFIFFSC